MGDRFFDLPIKAMEGLRLACGAFRERDTAAPTAAEQRDTCTDQWQPPCAAIPSSPFLTCANVLVPRLPAAHCSFPDDIGFCVDGDTRSVRRPGAVHGAGLNRRSKS